jgi:protein disulfide-isomerase/protein disulfide-isomerase A6
MFYLTKKDFDQVNPQAIKLRGITIVKFFAPWCGHCKSSQPSYESLDSVAGKEFNIAMYNIKDADNEKFLEAINQSSLNGYKVLGFPTHVVFVDGKFLEVYEGPRNAKAMLNYLLQIKTSR